MWCYINGDQAGSYMQMVLGLAMLIQSVLVKDRTVVEPCSRLNAVFHLAVRISHSDRKAE
jgi:hypothetical protein